MRRNPRTRQYVYLSASDDEPAPSWDNGLPYGVYAYPSYDGDELAVKFSGVKPYEFIIEPTVPVIDAPEYSNDDLRRALGRLRDIGVPVDNVLTKWEKFKSEFRHGNPFATLWYVVTHVQQRTDDDDPITWKRPGPAADPTFAAKLLREVGIAAVEDPDGIIAGTGAEHHLVAFYAPGSFRIVASGLSSTVKATLANQPWIEKVLEDEIPSNIPPRWIPRRQGGRILELGCGKFGCVVPTDDPGVVVKVTTDDTEAEFAEAWSHKLSVPVCVKYMRVVRARYVRHGLPVFVLWRESADEVGGMSDDTAEVVGAQFEAATEVYSLLQDQVSGARLEAVIAKWTSACSSMADVPELRYLSDGMLSAYKKHGLFFGDVHAGNVGLAPRGNVSQWVITDPGKVAIL